MTVTACELNSQAVLRSLGQSVPVLRFGNISKKSKVAK